MNYIMMSWGNLNEKDVVEISDLCRIFATDEKVGYEPINGVHLFYFNSTVVDELIVTEMIEMFHDKMHFIFSEFDDRMSAFIPFDLTNGMQDIFSMEENVGIDIDSVDDEDGEEDINYIRLKYNIEKQVKKPSLDYLLEQVKAKGINSLTKYEKSILEEYANKL